MTSIINFPAATSHLRLISEESENILTIPSNDGRRTFLENRQLFQGWFNETSFSTHLANAEQKPSPTLVAGVYEHTKTGEFLDIIGSFKKVFSDYRSFFWKSQDSTISFVGIYPNYLKKDGITFFPFLVKGTIVFILVHEERGRLKADVYPFGHSNPWNAQRRNRFVFCQPMI